MPIIQDWLEDDLCASEACPSTVVQEALNQVANTCSAEIEKQMWLPAIAQAVLIVSGNCTVLSSWKSALLTPLPPLRTCRATRLHVRLCA